MLYEISNEMVDEMIDNLGFPNNVKDIVKRSVGEEFSTSNLYGMAQELAIYEYLKDVKELLVVYPDIVDNPSCTKLHEARVLYQLELNNKITKDTKSSDTIIANSNAKCPKCGHTNTRCEERQMRSADEPVSLFFLCLDCKNKWRRG